MAKRKYLISICDSESNRVLFSFKSSKKMLFTITGLSVLLIAIITYIIVSFTPVKYTVPGYPSEESSQQALESLAKADSLEMVINTWSLQMANIRRILDGKEPLPLDSLSVSFQDAEVGADAKALYAGSDSLIREEVLNQEKFEIRPHKEGNIARIEGLHFFTPVQGVITQEFNKAAHPYIDIAAPDGSVIHSILDGTVIASFWDEKTGYNIMIQHGNDIVSIYKHNEKLLKQKGEQITAGTPVAIIGNTGNLSTGTHLHFELWYKGEAVNPASYINF